MIWGVQIQTSRPPPTTDHRPTDYRPPTCNKSLLNSKWNHSHANHMCRESVITCLYVTNIDFVRCRELKIYTYTYIKYFIYLYIYIYLYDGVISKWWQPPCQCSTSCCSSDSELCFGFHLVDPILLTTITTRCDQHGASVCTVRMYSIHQLSVCVFISIANAIPMCQRQ
jgi:hypothetical protein